ncbi:AraC family transcriptional regulator [Corallococcus sp. BB11-1]|uniref:AraC family transcriptional regulator n=1 Tax=Corallococcus sp. BB11-1 TaxID=2996783 RepID=UPI00226F8E7E|nr:AraC family transcriptional regulator [Corallococcus sp. BB11-1]MCY1030964.1 AraC family transcriptional regulator [Corallococcus sp. BB11-1]
MNPRTRILGLLLSGWASLANAQSPTAPPATAAPAPAATPPHAATTTPPAATTTQSAATTTPSATPPATSQGLPSTTPSATQAKLPRGWYVTESAPQHYEAGVDASSPCEGSRSAFLRSRTQATDSFGTFMQAFSAKDFQGKRLRFTAAVRHQDVKGWAGLWMRVEGPDPKQPLAFDNMQSRALVGTHGCKRYDVVLDVSKEATTIMAGLIMSGTGQAWLDGVRFEAVDASVKTTDLLSAPQALPSGPQGLDDEGPPIWGRKNMPLGRVGHFWFDSERVETNTPLVRGKGSTWKGSFGDELFEHGIEVNGTYEVRELEVKVRAGGAATLIEGSWGGSPVYVRLSADALVMRWGPSQRTLRRDPALSTEKGCNAYVQGHGGRVEDRVDVCGVALATRPPLTQLVAAFLSVGFRGRSDQPLNIDVKPPVRSPQAYDDSKGYIPPSRRQ